MGGSPMTSKTKQTRAPKVDRTAIALKDTGNQEFDNDWLDIKIPDDKLFNPMDYIFSDPDPEEIMKKLYILMSTPEYFRFVTKYILNVDLLPFQLVILRELWNKKFPMLIACRGGSKTYSLSVYCLLRALLLPKRKIVVVGAAFRQSKFLFSYMQDVWNNAPVLRDLCNAGSGCFGGVDRCTVKINNSTITCLPLGSGDTIRGERAHDIVADEFSCLASDTLIQTDDGLIEIADWCNGEAINLLNKDREMETPAHMVKTPLTDVYEIITENGFSFKCSNIHQVMTQSGWKLAKDLEVKKDSLVLDTNDYFPERYVEKNNIVLDEKIAWLLGLLVSEGTVTNRNYIAVSNTDKTLIDKIIQEFPVKWGISYKAAYKDGRGWDCKECWTIIYSNTDFRSLLFEFGLGYNISSGKTIPKDILRSPRSVIIAFLSGLYEGDGSAFNYQDNVQNKLRIGAAYYSCSKKMVDQIQVLLLKFGICSSSTLRSKNKISNNLNYMLSVRGENAYKLYKLLNVLKWKDKFEDGDFRVKKPQIRFADTIYGGRYYLSTTESNKTIHLGTFETEVEAIEFFHTYKKTSNFVLKVRSVKLLPEKNNLYDFYMPKTNSFMGNGFIQHNSIPIDILETVVFGFGVVAASPADKVRQKRKEKLGLIKADSSEPGQKENQIVIAGTAYYTFNHFYEYWKKRKSWLLTKGDPKKLSEVLGDSSNKGLKWTDYSIMRIPVSELPEGLLDEGIIATAKASTHSGTYNMEFNGIFSGDSVGFFKRTLIQSCTVTHNNPIVLPSGEVFFEAVLHGDTSKKYVYGVDPASEVDHFAIVVIEINGDHRRIVHVWTTNRKQHKEKVNAQVVQETDFYSYCSRKIRDLMKVFPCQEIALDSQGGGVAIMECLHDKDKIQAGELPIWPTIDEKEKDTDDKNGLHILRMCNFAKADWTGEANHGMRKDLEDRVLLFPYYDPIALEMSYQDDALTGRIYDTLEDCTIDIEELKDELAMIVVTQTPTGRERFDTPDSLAGTGKKGRVRKDRYSALVMANMSARTGIITSVFSGYAESGGFARRMKPEDLDDPRLYDAPDWFLNPQ